MRHYEGDPEHRNRDVRIHYPQAVDGDDKRRREDGDISEDGGVRHQTDDADLVGRFQPPPPEDSQAAQPPAGQQHDESLVRAAQRIPECARPQTGAPPRRFGQHRASAAEPRDRAVRQVPEILVQVLRAVGVRD